MQEDAHSASRDIFTYAAGTPGCCGQTWVPPCHRSTSVEGKEVVMADTCRKHDPAVFAAVLCTAGTCETSTTASVCVLCMAVRLCCQVCALVHLTMKTTAVLAHDQVLLPAECHQSKAKQSKPTYAGQLASKGRGLPSSLGAIGLAGLHVDCWGLGALPLAAGQAGIVAAAGLHRTEDRGTDAALAIAAERRTCSPDAARAPHQQCCCKCSECVDDMCSS